LGRRSSKSNRIVVKTDSSADFIWRYHYCPAWSGSPNRVNEYEAICLNYCKDGASALRPSFLSRSQPQPRIAKLALCSIPDGGTKFGIAGPLGVSADTVLSFYHKLRNPSLPS